MTRKVRVRVKKLSIKRSKKAKQGETTRITNDTVAEHREKILAGGRRFKYPIQYARHRLVINAIIIGLATASLLAAFGWQQLYMAQNSSAFFYRVTQILPLPVASVDGEPARYSDYLLNYRSSEHYLGKYDEVSLNSENGRLQLQYKKREALDIAVSDAYARKIAGSHDIAVSDKEVDGSLEVLRTTASGTVSRETSDTSTRRLLGLSPGDLETIVRNGILRGKAAFVVDTEAKKVQQEVDLALKNNKQSFEKVQGIVNKEHPDAVDIGITGLMDRSNMFGGLRASEVAQLAKGATSSVMRSVTSDGYYYVRVVEKTDKEVSFAFLHIPLTKFNDSLTELKEKGKVREYITIEINQPESNEKGEQQ